jgi:hypothetical protein
MKQHQVIAVCNAAKSAMHKAISDLYHKLQKPHLFLGLVKKYRPRDEEGDQLPPESTKVQVIVDDELKALKQPIVAALDALITMDATNALATADIVVDGHVLVGHVPVVTLLALEKVVRDWHALVEKIPVLDSATDWTTESTGISKSSPFETVRTKKVPIRFVKAEATDKHPAQVEILQEDVVAGYWTKVDLSGAWPAARKAETLQRIEKLKTALQLARNEANDTNAARSACGAALFEHCFGAS